MPHWLYVFLISIVPVIELRGAIPVAAALGLPFFVAYPVAVIGNMLPVPFILLFIAWFIGKMKVCRWNWVRRFAEWLENKAQKGAAKLKSGAFIGLFLFVAIPLPGTGAWTGGLIASLFGMNKKWAFFSILCGVLVAGVIMTLASYGVVGFLQFLAPAGDPVETAETVAAAGILRALLAC